MSLFIYVICSVQRSIPWFARFLLKQELAQRVKLVGYNTEGQNIADKVGVVQNRAKLGKFNITLYSLQGDKKFIFVQIQNSCQQNVKYGLNILAMLL